MPQVYQPIPVIGAYLRVSSDISLNRTGKYIPLSISIYTRVLVCVRMSSDYNLNNTSKHVLLEMANEQVFMINARAWKRDLRANYFSN